MILRSIQVNYWRHRLDPLRVEFGPGLNIIAGPNEAGKTTLREAIDFGLFERPDSARAGLQVIRPRGRDLKPAVALEFETGGQAYRVQKTFLESRRHTLLQQWEQGEWRPLAEDRDALARMEALLEADGLTHYRQVIWSTQGGIRHILSGELPAGLRERLAGVLAGLLLTDADRRFIERVEHQWGQYYTPAHRRPPKGSARQQAQAELAEARDRATDAEARWQDYEGLCRVLEGAGRLAGSLAEQSSRAREDLRLARQAKTAWDAYRRAAAEADAARGRAVALKELRRRWVEDIDKLEGLEQRRRLALEELKRAQACAGANQAEYGRAREAENRREAERRDVTRRQELLRLLRARHMERRLEHLAAAEPDAPDGSAMKTLRELMRQAQADQAGLDAMALTVSLTPERPLAGRAAGDGEPEQEFRLIPPGEGVWKATRSWRLRLDGIAALEVRTGMQNAAELKAQLDRALGRLREALDRWVPGCQDLAAGWAVLEERFDRAGSAREERTRLTDAYRAAFDWQPGEAGPRLEAWARAQPEEWGRALEAGWDGLELDALIELERAGLAGLTRLNAASQAAEPGLAALQAAARALEKAENDTAVILEGLAGEKRVLLRSLNAVQQQAAAEPELGVYSVRRWAEEEVFDGQAERACELLDRLTARATDTDQNWRRLNEQAELKRPQGDPITDATLLDLERKAADLEAASAAAERERAGLDGKVQARADGLGGHRHLARERLHAAEKQAEAQELEALAWDLLRTALEEERRGELAALLDPVRRRVEDRLGRITGERYHEIELDPESLRPTALTGAAARLDVRDQLSFGTQEQLALLVRLALAELMAPDSRQLLVLDDPLVNTDAVRQAAAWAILGEAAAGLQVILLTCHPVPAGVEFLAHVVRLD